jgi:hypothetical protein
MTLGRLFFSGRKNLLKKVGNKSKLITTQIQPIFFGRYSDENPGDFFSLQV